MFWWRRWRRTRCPRPPFSKQLPHDHRPPLRKQRRRRSSRVRTHSALLILLCRICYVSSNGQRQRRRLRRRLRLIVRRSPRIGHPLSEYTLGNTAILFGMSLALTQNQEQTRNRPLLQRLKSGQRHIEKAVRVYHREHCAFFWYPLGIP